MLITFKSFLNSGNNEESVTVTVTVEADYSPEQKQSEFNPPYNHYVVINNVKDSNGKKISIDEHNRTRWEEEACEEIEEKEKESATYRENQLN